MEPSFCIASKNVHSRRFDDEVIVIDVKSGIYFSLRGCAADVWSQIEASASRDNIEAALAALYDGDGETIRTATSQCLDEFLQGGLIREAPPSNAAAPHPANGARSPFAPPLIERFTDMQDLLLLDPIHEVSEEGWPNQPPGDRT